MKILLIGKNSQIGRALITSLQGLGELISCSRYQINLEELDQIRNTIRTIRPALIINSAAYTNVVKAEVEPILASRINGEAPKVIAQEAERLKVPLIHYSTDYVFDGNQIEPYQEKMQPYPINSYGQSKYIGEKAIARHCEAYWILRTSWVYSFNKNNFLTMIIRLAQEKNKFCVVNDQFGAPTWAERISNVTHQILTNKKFISNQHINFDYIRKTTGIYHVTASGKTSWYNYAVFIIKNLKKMGVKLKIKSINMITPISSIAYLSSPLRPKNSCLSCKKLASTFQIIIPNWQIDVVTCLQRKYLYNKIK